MSARLLPPLFDQYGVDLVLSGPGLPTVADDTASEPGHRGAAASYLRGRIEGSRTFYVLSAGPAAAASGLRAGQQNQNADRGAGDSVGGGQRGGVAWSKKVDGHHFGLVEVSEEMADDDVPDPRAREPAAGVWDGFGAPPPQPVPAQKGRRRLRWKAFGLDGRTVDHFQLFSGARPAAGPAAAGGAGGGC